MYITSAAIIIAIDLAIADIRMTNTCLHQKFIPTKSRGLLAIVNFWDVASWMGTLNPSLVRKKSTKNLFAENLGNRYII